MEDHRRRNRSKATVPEVDLDYMLLGTAAASQDSKKTSAMVTAVVGPKGLTELMISTVVSFPDELGLRSHDDGNLTLAGPQSWKRSHLVIHK